MTKSFICKIKGINNNITKTKHATKLELKLTELALTTSEHNRTDKTM